MHVASKGKHCQMTTIVSACSGPDAAHQIRRSLGDRHGPTMRHDVHARADTVRQRRLSPIHSRAQGLACAQEHLRIADMATSATALPHDDVGCASAPLPSQ